jgi:drug/metabolite transporter (DMT)-like permease
MTVRHAYVLLFFTSLFWAGNAVAGRLAAGEISPMLLTFLRWAAALAILLAIGWRRLRQAMPVVRANLAYFAALGGLGFAGFNLLFYAALNYTTALNATIEQAAMPMLIFLANFVFFRTPVAPVQFFGAGLTIVGVAVTALHGDFASLRHLQVNLGDLLMLIAIVLYAGFTVALRYKPEIHWQPMMIVMAAAAMLAALPFALWEIAAGNMIVPTARGLALTLYTAIFPAIFSQVFFIAAIGIIGSNRAGLFTNITPIIGAILSVLIVGEQFRAYHAVALALVLGGIWIAEQTAQKRS